MKYSHEHRNPCQSPNAFLVQTYIPPSSGNLAESDAMTIADGTKKSKAAAIQSVMDPGPECAAADSQRTPTTAEMLNRTRSQSRSSRLRTGWPSTITRNHRARSSLLSYTMPQNAPFRLADRPSYCEY